MELRKTSKAMSNRIRGDHNGIGEVDKSDHKTPNRSRGGSNKEPSIHLVFSAICSLLHPEQPWHLLLQKIYQPSRTIFTGAQGAAAYRRRWQINNEINPSLIWVQIQVDRYETHFSYLLLHTLLEISSLDSELQIVMQHGTYRYNGVSHNLICHWWRERKALACILLAKK